MGNVLNFKLTLEDLLGPKVASAIRGVQQLGRQVEKPMTPKLDTGQYRDSLGKLRDANGKFVAEAKSGFASLGGSGGLGGIMGLVAKLGLTTAVVAGGKAIVGMGTEMEQTRIQFETFAGSAEKGNRVIADMQKFANLTPFDDEQVIGAGRQLLAFGEDAKSLNPILTKLGNISSATGKDFGELVSIYGKNKLSGIIQGEDLNQLNDSGIPVMKSLAAQLGVNVSQVRKMGEQGKISFGMLDKAFDELGGKGGKWGNLMDKQSQTVAGRWSSLVGFAQNLGSKIGEGLNPFIGKIVDGGNALLQFIQGNTEKLKAMVAPVLGAMQPLFDAFNEIRQQLFGNAEAGDVLATVFNVVANAIRLAAPVIKIVAGLLGKVLTTVWDLIQGIVKFVQTHEWLQKYYAAIWGGAVAAFRGIAEVAGKFLGGVGHLLQGILTMDWSELKKGFAETVASMGQGPKIAGDMAKGAVKGWNEGIKPVKLFGTAKPGVAGMDAATAFTQGASQKPAALTAAASKGQTAGGASGVGGKGVTNIYFTVKEMLGHMTVEVASASEGAKQIAQLVRDTVIAELNDVNTLAST